MIFWTDEYFHIGQMHLLQGKPCQDYAFSSVYESVGFAVVSDGCSSGRHTDIGSRVIALSTASAVKQLASFLGKDQKLSDLEPNSRTNHIIDGIRQQQENASNITRSSLNLDLLDMLATCGYVLLSSTGGFVHLRGDGAIAIVENDRNMHLTLCQWDKNTPLYPAYAEDEYQRFIDFHGGDKSAKVLKVESWKVSPDKSFTKEKESLVSISDGILGTSLEFSLKEIENLSHVGIFTDGVVQVGSITGGGTDFLDWKDVVSQLMSFKSPSGEFAKRRMIRFLKDQQKNGKVPLDDMAYAVVKIEKGQ